MTLVPALSKTFIINQDSDLPPFQHQTESVILRAFSRQQMVASMTLTNLIDLPDEILRCICFFVDWHDALCLQASCRSFTNVANEHLLWKYHCRTNFGYWAASHQLQEKLGDSSFVEWKQLFKQRYLADSTTRSTLNRVISSQTARTPKIEAIIALGHDSKDVLLQNYARASEFNDLLARRYIHLYWYLRLPSDNHLDTGQMWRWGVCIVLSPSKNGRI
jgi:hypothetical protein